MTFKMADKLKPKVAVLFKDQFIGLVPRKKTVRITSKLELGNYDFTYKMKRFESILNTSKLELGNYDFTYKMKRFESILNTLKPFIVEFQMEDIEYWTGFRPLTPNDIPLFGRDESYENIIHANGMGWLGITFGPAIGDQ